jgi:hypothetical protein
MAKAKKTALRIVQGEMEVIGLLLVELKDEILLKPTGDGVDVHWSQFMKDGGMWTHVTHEKYHDRRRHRQIHSVSRDRMAKATMAMFSQPGDPVPEFKSLDDEKDRKRIEEWFERVGPKVFHPPSEELVEVLREGPVKDFVNALLSWDKEKKIDIGPLMRKSRALKASTVQDAIKQIKESEMAEDRSVVGFKGNPPRTVFAFKGGLVMEVHNSSVEESHILREGMTGIEGFVKTLERKGLLPKDI